MKKILIAMIILFLLSACSSSPEETPSPFNPTIEVDEVCAGLLNNTFISKDHSQTSESEGQQIVSPLRVSFLLDGRVIWNYEDNQSYIGTFTCLDGDVSATFTEGSQPSFTGKYDPQAGTIEIDGIIYFVDTET